METRALRLWRLARASKDWVLVPGTFAKCKLREERQHSEHGTNSTWHIDVHYKFEADGKRRSGRRRVWSEEAMQNKLVAQLRFKRLKRTDVKVLYNPKDPSESILYPGEWGTLKAHLIGGGVLLALAVVLALL